MKIEFLKPQSLFNFYMTNNVMDDNWVNNINQIVSDLKFEEGLILNNELKESSRNSKIKWVYYNSNTSSIFKDLQKIIIRANNEAFNFDLKGSEDPIQYTEYYSNTNGRYNWHQDDKYDFDPGLQKTSFRKLSLTIQLTDPNEYEGGDLEIYNPHPEKGKIVKIPKEKGKIIIFPSYMWHRVTPVTKGIRKSLVWWVGGSQFR